MNSLVVVNICIILLHTIFILVNAGATKGPGGSSCRYSGYFDPKDKICDKDVVQLKFLPTECTAYVFDGVKCDQNYLIGPSYIPEDLDHLKMLINFDNRAHKVFLMYTHGDLKDWSEALFSGDFPTEAQALKTFTVEYPVTGLILNGIERTNLSVSGNFYQQFTAYVKAIKTANPDLEIGLYLSAKTFVESGNAGANSTWFDFCMINDIIDFYIIEFATFNECSEDFLRSGITPVASSKPGVMTLNKFADALEQSNIDKEKMFFEFLISPVPKPEEKKNFNNCQISYNEYCKEAKFRPKMCVDNQNALFAKGQFAQQYSKGFVARDIDLVDRNNHCACNNKFITFFILLNGYNNGKNLPGCDAFKSY